MSAVHVCVILLPLHSQPRVGDPGRRGGRLGNENPLSGPAQILAAALAPRRDGQAAEKHASEPVLLGKDQ